MSMSISKYCVLTENTNLFSKLTDKNGTHLAKNKNCFVWYNYAVESFTLIINNYLPRTVLHDMMQHART